MDINERFQFLLDSVINESKDENITKKLASLIEQYGLSEEIKDIILEEFGYTIYLPGDIVPETNDISDINAIIFSSNDANELSIEAVYKQHERSESEDQTITNEFSEDSDNDEFITEDDIFFDDRIISVNMHELAVINNLMVLKRDGINSLLVDLVSGAYSVYGYDVNNISEVLYQLQQVDIIDTYDYASYALEGIFDNYFSYVPCTSVEYKQNHSEVISKINNTNTDKAINFIDKMRFLSWVMYPYTYSINRKYPIIKLGNKGIDAHNKEHNIFIRLLGENIVAGTILSGDKFPFHGIYNKASTTEQSFDFDEYIKKLQNLKVGDKVNVVFNGVFYSENQRIFKTDAIIKSFKDKLITLSLNVSVSNNGIKYEEITTNLFSFLTYCIFPVGIEPMTKKELNKKIRQIQTIDVNVMSFILPRSFEEVVCIIDIKPTSLSDLKELSKTFPFDNTTYACLGNAEQKEQNSFKNVKQYYNPFSNLLKRFKSLNTENNFYKNSFTETKGLNITNEVKLQREEFLLSLAKFDKDIPIVSVKQFIYTFPKTCVLNTGHWAKLIQNGKVNDTVYIDVSRKLMMTQVQFEKYISNYWLDIIDPIDNLNININHFEDIFDYIDVEKMNVEYSYEYRRIKKYSGDILLGDDDDVQIATFEDISSNYTADAENLTTTVNTLYNEIHEFMKKCCGCDTFFMDGYMKKIMATVHLFLERSLHSRFNKIIKDKNLLVHPVTKPMSFYLSDDLYSKMSVLFQDDVEILRDIKVASNSVFPAVIKVLIRLKEISLHEGSNTEQYKTVDKVYTSTYLQGKKSSEIDAFIKDINNNAKYMIQLDYVIKGIVNTESMYLKHTVDFPDIDYSVAKWYTYRPYFKIDPSKSISEDKIYHKYMHILHSSIHSIHPNHIDHTNKPLPANSVISSKFNLNKNYHDFIKNKHPDIYKRLLSSKQYDNEHSLLADFNNIQNQLPKRVEHDNIKQRKDLVKGLDLPPKVSKNVRSNMLSEFLKANNHLGVKTINDIDKIIIDKLFDKVMFSTEVKKLLIDGENTKLTQALMNFVLHRLNTILSYEDKKIVKKDFLENIDTNDQKILCLGIIVYYLNTLSKKKEVVTIFNSVLSECIQAQNTNIKSLDERFERIREDFNQKIYGALKGLDKHERNIYTDLLEYKLVKSDQMPNNKEEGTEMIPVNRDDDEYAEQMA
jgi:hypothetical protein